MIDNKTISAGKIDPVEVLLKTGGEGGSLSIQRFRATDGMWKFIFIRDEATMADFLDEEDQIDLFKKYPPVETFAEAIQLMNKYPWHELHLISMHPEYANVIQAEKKKRSTLNKTKFVDPHGRSTSDVAKAIRAKMNKRGFDVYCGHGEKGPFIGKIVSSIKEKYKRGDELAHLDIAIVKKDTNDAVALIEIEETNDKPKTLLSDLFGTLMGNFISLPGQGKIAVGNQTTLIMVVKGKNHGARNKYICEKAMMAKPTLGTGNSQIGNIVINSFTDNEKLKKVLVRKINEAIRRNA